MVIKIRDKYASTLTDQQNRELVKLNSALESEKKKKFVAIDRAEEFAIARSKKYGKKLRRIVIAVFFVIFVFGLLATILNVISLNANAIWKIILIIIGFLGLLDCLRSRKGWIIKKINIMKKRRFDSLYDSEVQKINQYFN